MRPLELKIEGFRSYDAGTPATIRFSDLKETVAIIGDTGSGKSSILEALTWALYGETSHGARVIQQVMNDDSTTTAVDLVFEAAARKLRVHRTARRTKKGQVVGGGAVLTETRPGTDAAEIVIADGVQNVNEQIHELIGMNCNAFLRTTILPQGRFSRLLAEDDQKIRATVLRQIWATTEVDRARENVERAVSQCKELAIRCNQDRRRYAEDTEAQEQELRTAAERTRRAAETAKTTVETYRAAEAEYTESRKQEEAAHQTLQRLQQITSETQWRVQEITDSQHKLEDLEQAKTDAATALNTIRRAEPRTTDASLDEAIDASFNTLQSAISTARANGSTRADAQENVTRAQNARDTTRDRLKTVEADLAQVTGEREKAEAKAVLTASNHDKLLGRYEAADAAAAEADAVDTERLLPARKRLKAAEAAADTTRADARRASADREQQEQRYQSAQNELAETTRHASAAAASAQTVPGDPCPVCDRKLPHDWTKPSEPELDAVTEREATERRRTDEATRHETMVHAELSGAETAIANAKTEITEASTRTGRLRTAVGERLGLSRDETSDAELTTQIRNELSQVRNTLEHYRKSKEEAAATAAEKTSAAAALETTVQLVRERLSALEREVMTETGRLVTAETDFAEQLKRWTETVKTLESHRVKTAGITAPANIEEMSGTRLDAVDAGIEEHRRKRAKNRATATRYREALLTAHDTLRQATDAAEHYRRNTLEPMTEAIPRLARETTEFAAAAGLDTTEQQTPRHTLATTLPKAKDAYAKRASDAHSRASVASSRMDAMAASRDRAAVLERQHNEAERTAEQLAHAKWELTNFLKIRPRVNALDQLTAEVTNRHHRLEELRQDLMDGHFPKYVTLRRSARLLANASRHLQVMTGQRYGFIDPPEDRQGMKRKIDKLMPTP